jgi:hypothetical protein
MTLSVSPTPTFSGLRWASQAQPTAANASYTAPTNTKLLAVAGPDGSLITKIGAVALVAQTSANQVQLYKSPDAGTTFLLTPLTATFAVSAAAFSVVNVTQPDGVTLGEQSVPQGGGYPLGGVLIPNMLASINNSGYSTNPLYFTGLPSQGSANAQTVPQTFQNGAYSALTATPSTGTIVDFTPSYTNSGAATLKIGGQSGTPAIVRAGTLTALTGGELTARFPVRVIWDGTNWQLLITERLYVAMNQAQNISVEAQGVYY